MRLTIIAAVLFVPALSTAQSRPCAQYPLGFDPYKPSHLAIVRTYGASVLAQAPLDALLRLDPYVPTEAALLRQMGGALPFWAYPAYPWYPPMQPSSPCESVRETTTPALAPFNPPLATFNDVLAVVERRAPATTGTTSQTPPERNRGITIQHQGRIWVSAGPAVRFSEREFVRIGESSGSPIFRRVGRETTVVYVPTAPGMVAPFRSAR